MSENSSSSEITKVEEIDHKRLSHDKQEGGGDRVPSMKIVITSIWLRDLKDTGTFLDPQDPCIHITIGKAVHKTKRKPDAGVNAVFNDIIELEITDEEYYGKCSLEVFNEHVTGLKKHVGVGTVEVKDIWPNKNVTTSFTLSLVNNNSKKESKMRGLAIITGKLIDDRSIFDECACNVS